MKALMLSGALIALSVTGAMAQTAYVSSPGGPYQTPVSMAVGGPGNGVIYFANPNASELQVQVSAAVRALLDCNKTEFEAKLALIRKWVQNYDEEYNFLVAHKEDAAAEAALQDANSAASIVNSLLAQANKRDWAACSQPRRTPGHVVNQPLGEDPPPQHRTARQVIINLPLGGDDMPGAGGSTGGVKSGGSSSSTSGFNDWMGKAYKLQDESKALMTQLERVGCLPEDEIQRYTAALDQIDAAQAALEANKPANVPPASHGYDGVLTMVRLNLRDARAHLKACASIPYVKGDLEQSPHPTTGGAPRGAPHGDLRTVAPTVETQGGSTSYTADKPTYQTQGLTETKPTYGTSPQTKPPTLQTPTTAKPEQTQTCPKGQKLVTVGSRKVCSGAAAATPGY
jgi:hypothetical protein